MTPLRPMIDTIQTQRVDKQIPGLGTQQRRFQQGHQPHAQEVLTTPN